MRAVKRVMRRWAVITASLLGGSIALMVAAACYLMLTQSGRRTTADMIEAVVSDQIPGSISIGRIEQIGRTTYGSDLVLRHPDGREVVRIKRAAIDFHFASFLRLDLGVHRARLENSRLSLWIGPDGRSSIEAALDFPDRVAVGDESPFHYWLHDIEVRDSLVVLRLSKDTTYRIQDARGRVEVSRARGVMVDLSNISGRVKPTLVGMDLRLLDVDGWIRGSQRQVLKLTARARVGDGDLRAKIALFDRNKTPVEVSLDRIDGSDASIAAALVYAKGQLTDDVDITLGGT